MERASLREADSRGIATAGEARSADEQQLIPAGSHSMNFAGFL
jgi:hypothetical protein